MEHLIDLCADLPVRTFEAGEAIIEENHKDNCLYILRSGAVEVRKREIEINRVSSRGSVFGEVGVILEQPHGATVVALEKSEFHWTDDGSRFLADNPAVSTLISRILAMRLRNLTDELVEFRELVDTDEEFSSQFGGVMKMLVEHHMDREY